ncbi:MAG: thermonuclease family protein [Deltaproteobacteria bacterium]|nr:thermonuclease family protein [Deltaproteobacteria bacterium]
MNCPGTALARSFICLAIFLILAAPVRADQLSGTVTWIYDGDTIRVTNVGKVRLLGIDAPETEDSPRDAYYMRQRVSRKTLRKVAAQATDFNISHAKKKTVRLETAGEKQKDDYGRLLALVYLPDGRLLNRLLVENGLAAVYRRFDFNLKKDFLIAEKKARKRGKGLWKK